MNQVIDFSKMQVGKKGGGKHWTKKEVESRKNAAAKVTRKKKVSLKMPTWLEEEARAVWKKTIRDMKDFEVLDKVDEDVLAAYCDAVARHKELSEMIRNKGYTICNAAGSLVEAPWVKTQLSYARLIVQYSDKLGLNANSRARLARKMAQEEDDPNADLFD
ncbi:phage terminase small subunit P27 family [Brevibacillus agri]|uniref:phage terminase small subunit P27 family n=1 Tax=Brevibacillus agri TaxID=51101 RepID=UPI0002A4D9F7|nr:phage terminase small subunit P27 family [Brevibacillus agri]ELK44004.1 P27 family phage terminase small subunit [Brevibacillus agri BAB-2500]MED1642150.1 phage terminase small subunit P27 family [Brevibacillus agri]MED1654435.1 phage terminase small subunit P27 family [Brevibacillus agri]MED1688118.1 phage terminase small subunit P27 family [Brevibacillus agri]MED1691152.1 phage terminase small subunit P27 family [Brevibacillus agri]